MATGAAVPARHLARKPREGLAFRDKRIVLHSCKRCLWLQLSHNERERARESESECVLARVQVWVLLPSLLQAVGWVITMQGTLQRASIFLRRQ